MSNKPSLPSVFAALLLWAAFPPLGQWYLVFPALVLLWFAIDRYQGRRLWAVVGFPFAFTFFALLCFWLRTVHVYVGWPLALLAWMGGALFESLFWVVGFWIYGRWRWPYPLNLIFFAVVWLGIEFLRAQGPWGNTLGVAWTPLVEAPMMAVIARGLGFWGTGVLVLGITQGFYGVVRALLRRQYPTAMFTLNACLCLLFAWLYYGRLTLPALHNLPSNHPLRGQTVALLQGNFDQQHKLSTAYFAQMAGIYLAETARLSPDVSLVFWPETVIPTYVMEWPWFRTQLQRALADRPAELIFGTPIKDDTGRFYNAAVLCDSIGQRGVYTKTALVPFGEYMPLRSVFHHLFAHNLYLQADYSRGTATAPLMTLHGKAGVMICFESTLPQLAVRAHQPDWLLVLTNDAWFLDSAFAQLHLQMSRWRAVESDCPLFFVSNTGASAVVDGAGRIKASLALGKRGQIVYHFPL